MVKRKTIRWIEGEHGIYEIQQQQQQKKDRKVIIIMPWTLKFLMCYGTVVCELEIHWSSMVGVSVKKVMYRDEHIILCCVHAMVFYLGE